ncbi:MAG: cell envelope integrity protein CreD, partial [Akkermansiaceae bacterium]|nr:cell envelope integrity protein CreD [Akkermansiaceae bacterium]
MTSRAFIASGSGTRRAIGLWFRTSTTSSWSSSIRSITALKFRATSVTDSVFMEGRVSDGIRFARTNRVVANSKISRWVHHGFTEAGQDRAMDTPHATAPAVAKRPSFLSTSLTSWPLAWKLGMIGILILLLHIPLAMTGGVLRERQQFQKQAVQGIEQLWGGRQLVCGPVLEVPYRYPRGGMPESRYHD